MRIVSTSVFPNIDCIGLEPKARANSEVPFCSKTTTISSIATIISSVSRIVLSIPIGFYPRRRRLNLDRVMVTDIISFLQGVREELKKVVWPSRELVIRASVAVVVFVLFFTLYLWILDLIFVKMISLVFNKL